MFVESNAVYIKVATTKCLENYHISGDKNKSEHLTKSTILDGANNSIRPQFER